jgi:hypothetical protein
MKTSKRGAVRYHLEHIAVLGAVRIAFVVRIHNRFAVPRVVRELLFGVSPTD